MKRALLAVIMVACFSSAVLAVGLTRVYVIVNIDGAPIEILKFSESPGEDLDEILSAVRYKNRTDKNIEAHAITMIYYDAFNEKEDGRRGISTTLLRARQQISSEWFAFRGISLVKTAIAYVSAVRFIDGEVWKADIEDVFRIAGDMPELSFLSEPEMLEIEKE